jgi:cell wall-associated NlpC family hydrolase
MRTFFMLLSGWTAVSACSLSFAPETADPRDLATRQTVLETALGQLGRPYLYGGGDGEGFDCSGLVQHVYAEVGIALPRTAREQRSAGRVIALRQAEPGDLVFFGIRSGIHVGIYVGDERFVHAPAAGKDVMLASVTSPYWQNRLVQVVRILP